MIVFRNLMNNRSAMVLVHQYNSGTTADSKISFRYDGGRYTMDEVLFPGPGGRYAPLKGKSERGDTERGLAATVRLLTK